MQASKQASRFANLIIASLLGTSEFQKWVRGRRFRNPATGNQVLFKSLPLKEQHALYQDWWRSHKRKHPESARSQIERARREGKKINFSGQDLSQANLRGQNLRGANLEAATLNLANLSDSNLERAKMRGASLLKAKMQGANLRHANLRDTDFGGADLRNVDFRGAVMQNTNFQGADLRGADLRNTVIASADFTEARLEGAKTDGMLPQYLNQALGENPVIPSLLVR